MSQRRISSPRRRPLQASQSCRRRRCEAVTSASPSCRHRIAVSRQSRISFTSPSRWRCNIGVATPSRRFRVSVPSRRHRVAVIVDLESRWRRLAVTSFIACRRVGIASLSRVDLASRWRRLYVLCRIVGIASPSRRRLVAVASASRRLRVAKFSRWRRVSSRWHRLGVAPLQASRCRCVGVAAVNCEAITLA